MPSPPDSQLASASSAVGASGHSPPPSNRYDYLDGLRGYAILGVVLVHSSQCVGNLPRLIHSIAGFGALGVQLFFVVSGLTLSTIYSKREIDWREFYQRRYFRLSPMFYIGAIAYSLLAFTPFSRYSPPSEDLIQWLTTLTFTHGWSPHTINSIVPGGWSVAGEAMFYICFPLLMMYAKNLRSSAIMVAVTIAIAITSFIYIRIMLSGRHGYESGTFNYYFWMTNLPSFALGIFIRSLNNADTPIATRLKRLAQDPWLFPGVCAMIAITAVSGVSTFITTQLMLALFAFCISVRGAPLAGKLGMNFLGRISYSVYLVHFGVIALTESLAVYLFKTFGATLAVLIYFPITLILSSALSFITYNIIEKPGIALGKRQYFRSRTAT